jgi:hypothetical protein
MSRRRRGRSTSGKRSRVKSGRSRRPAVDGASGKDAAYKVSTLKCWWEASGSAHGLIVARKEGNASGAKEPWARMVGASGKARAGERTVQRWQNSRSLTNRVVNRRVDSGMHAMA